MIDKPNDGLARLYLMAQRKCWYHDNYDGWTEEAWERFDYVECGIYTKPLDKLTDEDRKLIESYGEPGREFVFPTPREPAQRSS